MSEELFPQEPRPLRDVVLETCRIVDDAVAEHHPVRTYILFSGGDDSLTLLDLCDWAAHGVVFVNTGTGIPETTEFVRTAVAENGLPLYELTPPKSYEQVFINEPIINGLPGPGLHTIAYNRLKERALHQFRNDHCLQGGERIMFLTGIRRDESVKRMTYTDSVVDREGRIVWVNPLYWVTRRERDAYLAAQSQRIRRNPVSEHLHISGECLCGCFARPGELEEIRFFYPSVAERIEGWQAAARANGLKYCVWGERRGDEDGRARLCEKCIGQQEMFA